MMVGVGVMTGVGVVVYWGDGDEDGVGSGGVAEGVDVGDLSGVGDGVNVGV